MLYLCRLSAVTDATVPNGAMASVTLKNIIEHIGHDPASKGSMVTVFMTHGCLWTKRPNTTKNGDVTALIKTFRKVNYTLSNWSVELTHGNTEVRSDTCSRSFRLPGKLSHHKYELKLLCNYTNDITTKSLMEIMTL